jgi:CO/xanthine dehydrogenase Mo-binding subunit
MSSRHGELLPFFGGGIVFGAAIANAGFDAVGARVLRMPITQARVRAALPTL